MWDNVIHSYVRRRISLFEWTTKRKAFENKFEVETSTYLLRVLKFFLECCD